MLLDKKQIEYIASLARLELTPQEILRFQKELSKILDYIDQLKEIGIEGVEPTIHTVSLANVFRQDNSQIQHDQNIADKILKSAPARQDNYFKVKSVFERD